MTTRDIFGMNYTVDIEHVDEHTAKDRREELRGAGYKVIIVQKGHTGLNTVYYR
jgi:hypothetical protein